METPFGSSFQFVYFCDCCVPYRSAHLALNLPQVYPAVIALSELVTTSVDLTSQI